ncbi:hypothetical protein [Nocardia cyriacigeorgica]|nr:hypothetical protein [Nocardia cyriacigeorgica]TLF55274.1 hypothetical protein FEK31_20980 [Nocardia cyriacigeorgica]
MSIVQIFPQAVKPTASNKVSTLPTKAAQRPPCADLPDNWDLDTGTPAAWHAAVETCSRCPLFLQCRQLAQTLIARGDGPRAMIWAGVAYDNSGNVVENLDRHRAVPLDHKRPMRIIRTGARPLGTESVVTAPRRRIVLGRPLTSTGTDGR